MELGNRSRASFGRRPRGLQKSVLKLSVRVVAKEFALNARVSSLFLKFFFNGLKFLLRRNGEPHVGELSRVRS